MRPLAPPVSSRTSLFDRPKLKMEDAIRRYPLYLWPPTPLSSSSHTQEPRRRTAILKGLGGIWGRSSMSQINEKILSRFGVFSRGLGGPIGRCPWKQIGDVERVPLGSAAVNEVLPGQRINGPHIVLFRPIRPSI